MNRRSFLKFLAVAVATPKSLVINEAEAAEQFSFLLPDVNGIIVKEAGIVYHDGYKCLRYRLVDTTNGGVGCCDIDLALLEILPGDRVEFIRGELEPFVEHFLQHRTKEI
jgi:hypothetical protein